MEDLQKRLIEKSIEAFIMGLEVYNKPTIRYRIEGFSFFIINAWELMLKATLLARGESIYYDEKQDRTLSINDVIGKIYTDKSQPLRLNLEKIIELRNTSTHFITEDYETIYAPFFQATIFNFSEQIERFHNVDITRYIAQNFLTLSVNINTLTTEQIRAKYTKEMAEKLITAKNDNEYIIANHSSSDLYIPLQHNFFITKKKQDADLLIAVTSGADNSIAIVKELQDPNDKYKLTYNNVIKSVEKQIKTKRIPFEFNNQDGTQNPFNTYVLNLIINFYGIKSNERYAFKFAGVYRYSQQLVEFIVEEIKKDARIVEHLLGR